MSSPRLISCPQCKQETQYSPNNPYRPFCCERCKLIDLGLWASEQYQISEPATAENIFAENTSAEHAFEGLPN